MKDYCLNCGHPNNYFITKPDKCEKCGINMSSAKIKPAPMKTVFDNLTFDESEEKEEVLPPLEFEPFTEAELESLNIANANKAFNLGNLIRGQDVGKIPKRRGRPPKR